MGRAGMDVHGEHVHTKAVMLLRANESYAQGIFPVVLCAPLFVKGSSSFQRQHVAEVPAAVDEKTTSLRGPATAPPLKL